MISFRPLFDAGPSLRAESRGMLFLVMAAPASLPSSLSSSVLMT